MIRTETDGDVRTIVLDRPERRNAVTTEGLEELLATVEGADEPVILLSGAGDAFCAGADLEEVEALDDAAEARAFARMGQDVARALATYDGATVAGVDGAARGGGVELALACDLRICTEGATFAEPGVGIGLFGAWGGTARLPAVVGRGHALDLALSGRVVDAADARAMGLVSRVVADPRAVAEEIAANDARAVRAVAALLRGTAGDGDATARDASEERERAVFAELVAAGRPVRKG